MKATFETWDHFNIKAWEMKGFPRFPPMFHSHCELVFVLDGEINLVIDGIERTIRAGEIATVFPYVTHSYSDAPSAHAVVILCNPDATSQFESALRGKKPICPYTDRLSHLEGAFRRIPKLLRVGGTTEQSTATAHLSVIIGEILLDMPQEKNDTEATDTLKKILIYCSEHFADEDISLQKVSDALYISQSYVSKVFSRMDMFEAIAKGYCRGAKFLTQGEKEELAFSAQLITMTIGIRFLTDYLQGDTYFHIKRPGHNVDRCRTQLKMVQSMEEQAETMEAIIKKALAEA